jgi:hypothetical protein
MMITLLLVGQEYDHPAVQAAVMELISAEMRSFTPSASSYLSYLAYPQLKFANSPVLQVSYVKILALTQIIVGTWTE